MCFTISCGEYERQLLILPNRCRLDMVDNSFWFNALHVQVFTGMAQKVWNDLPVLIALLPCVYVLVNSFSGVWASQGIFQDQQQFFFDATIDLSYQIASYKDNTSKEKGTVNLHERFFQ